MIENDQTTTQSVTSSDGTQNDFIPVWLPVRDCVFTPVPVFSSGPCVNEHHPIFFCDGRI